MESNIWISYLHPLTVSEDYLPEFVSLFWLQSIPLK